MIKWLPGLIALLLGVAWIAFRVSVERRAVTGSWWSQLVKELAVIRELPVIGLLWRLLPILLIVAGGLWLAGVRPEWPSGAPGDGTLCGDESARPRQLPLAEWADYRCAGERDARERWERCLSRRNYTSAPGRGCPGAERCCPPD